MECLDKIKRDSLGALPLYQRIKECILEKIAKGEWKPLQKLPSENEISSQLDVSRMTVNRAFKELTEEGYLFREKGSGTFVAEPFQLTPFFELMPISQEIAVEGNHYSATLLLQEEGATVAEAYRGYFNTQDAPLFYSEILYFKDQSPIQYEKRAVLAQFAPGYGGENFEQDCSTAYLLGVSPILSQQHRLEAIVPSREICELLQIEQGEACFKVVEKLLLRQQVVSYAEQYYPASRYQFHSKV